MKLIKRSNLNIIFTVIMAFLSFHIWQYDLHWISWLPKLNWLAAAISLIIIISPLGSITLKRSAKKRSNKAIKKPKEKEILSKNKSMNKKPTDNRRTLSYLQLQANVIVIQLCLATILYSLYLVCNTLFIHAGHSTHTQFTGNLIGLLQHNALFPWPTIALTTVLMCHIIYNKKESSSMKSMLINQKTSNRFLIDISHIFNTWTRLGTICVLGSTLGVTILISTICALNMLHHNLYHGQSMFVLILIIAIYFLVRKKTIKHHVSKLLSKKVKPYKIIFLLTIITTAALVLLDLFLPSIGKNIIVKAHWLTPALWRLNWKVTMLMWSLAWCMPISLWISRIAAGFKIRSIIISQLLLPMLAVISYYLMSTHHLVQSAFSISHSIHFSQAILCMLSTFILIVMFSHDNILSMITNIEIQKDGEIKKRKLLKPIYLLFLTGAGSITMIIQAGFHSASIMYILQFLPLVLLSYTAIIICPLRQLFHWSKQHYSMSK